MSTAAQAPANDSLVVPDHKVEGVLSAIRILIATLSPEERQRVVSEMEAGSRPVSHRKAGEVLGTIVRLLPQQKSWTVVELKEKVEELGLDASAKSIYNAMGYLTRKGQVRRIGYGRYIVDGVELRTMDDLGGEPTSMEGGPDD